MAERKYPPPCLVTQISLSSVQAFNSVLSTLCYSIYLTQWRDSVKQWFCKNVCLINVALFGETYSTFSKFMCSITVFFTYINEPWVIFFFCKDKSPADLGLALVTSASSLFSKRSHSQVLGVNDLNLPLGRHNWTYNSLHYCCWKRLATRQEIGGRHHLLICN